MSQENEALKRENAELQEQLSAWQSLDGFKAMGMVLSAFYNEMSRVIGIKDGAKDQEFLEHRKRATDSEAAQLLGIIGEAEEKGGQWTQKQLVEVLTADGEETRAAVRQRVIRITKALAFFGVLERRVVKKEIGLGETTLRLTPTGKKMFDTVRSINISPTTNRKEV